jgi:uncharacterized protein YndB with AHSA1/START domain
MTLPHRLHRTITIRAPRETVFEFLTDNARWASWWGAGSTIEPRRGGAVRVRHPNGIEMAGEVLDFVPLARLVFTFGYPSGQPMPVDGSRVTIELEDAPGGTRLTLTHDFSDEPMRDEFVQGWRYQLALFSNAVLGRLHAGAATTVDRWFAAWADPEPESRHRALAAVAASDVVFRDRYGYVRGIDDLAAHVTAVLRFMPGVRLERQGDVRHCQGALLVNWSAVDESGQARGAGTNAFELDATGRIGSVVGFWA